MLVSGDIDEASDGQKFCGRSRTVLWAKKLTVADVNELARHVGHGSTAYNETDIPYSLAQVTYNSDKAEKWLTAWAKKNGCNDSGKDVIVVEVPPPAKVINEKLVLVLLDKMNAKTEKELEKIFKTFGYDTDADCEDGEQGLSELLDEMDGNSIDTRSISIKNGSTRAITLAG